MQLLLVKTAFITSVIDILIHVHAEDDDAISFGSADDISFENITNGLKEAQPSKELR